MKNIKIFAAMILVLTMCMSMAGAFATEEVMVVTTPAVEIPVLQTATPAPEAETVVDPTAEPIAEVTVAPTVEVTSEPTVEATVEVTAEPTVEATVEVTAEPTVEATVEPTVEPTVQPTVEATVEPTVQPTEDPIVEDMPVVEDEPLDPTPLAAVEGTVEIYLVADGDIYFGDTVKLVAKVEGYTMAYTLQWQYNDGSDWQDIADETGDTLEIEVTEENAAWEWRIAVITEEAA